MDTEALYHKGASLLPAIAYGDAAGLPVETRSADYIRQRYGRITELLPSNENPFFAGAYDPGQWSDDTQLSLAVARSLVNTGGFSLTDQAREHIAAYDETPDMEWKGVTVKRGWGKSTLKSIRQLKDGVSPEASGVEGGAGNGVLMKMAPLVYWQVSRSVDVAERYGQYDSLTSMTHDSDIARLTTRVHGDMLAYLMEAQYTQEGFYERLVTSARTHEATLGTDGSFSQSILYLAQPVNAETILSNTDGQGFYAPQTLAMAYGAFVARGGHFTESVFEAVNLGGDTDSTASVVAAMSCLAMNESLRIPIDHQNIDRLTMIKRVSQQLANTALGC
jgi:ADP-ribosyl-[dinitrogen reductase] hydrolase